MFMSHTRHVSSTLLNNQYAVEQYVARCHYVTDYYVDFAHSYTPSNPN
jgi:hypothetical protein